MEKHYIAIIQTVIQVLLTVGIGFFLARNMEKLKTELTKKFWVKQQIWDTRKKAYDGLIESFYETKEYLHFQIEYTNEYLDAYERIGCNSEGDEEYHNSYAAYVKEEQIKFDQKYQSTEAIADRLRIETDTKTKLTQLKKTLDTKFIYLHSDIGQIKSGLESIITQIFKKAREQEQHEDLDDYLESIIADHTKLSNDLTDLIVRTQVIASEHLELRTS